MSEVTLPLAEIKKRLSEIVDGFEDRHDRVVLTRNGRPAAVILSPDDLEALEDTLELLSDQKAMSDPYGRGSHRRRQGRRRCCPARQVPQALMAWRLLVASGAERSLARLPERVAASIVEFMVGSLLDEPRRVGKSFQ